MSAPTKEFQRLMLSGTVERPLLRHGGNAAIRWQIDNFGVAMDAAGNVKPDKAHSADKIDGPVAAIMAVGRAIVADPPQQSAYETGGLMWA
ncbi:terminase TerL endonuclease subunit [Nocardia takedensis]